MLSARSNRRSSLDHVSETQLSKIDELKDPGPGKDGGRVARCLTICPPHGKINGARASPSGKALAFQANIRGFESRRPLLRKCSGIMCQATIHWNMTPEHLIHGPVAQWLEQATHNRLIVGSNPTGPTFTATSNAQLLFRKIQLIRWTFAFW